MFEFLIILICTILFYYNRKKIRIFFNKKIKSVDIEAVHKIFEPAKISEDLLGPNEDLIIQSFSIPSSYKVVGMTFDYESCKDVCKYINELEKEKKIFHIKNTSMCYFKNNP